MIRVIRTADGEPMEFSVTIAEDGGETHHRVTLSRRYCQELGGDSLEPDALIEAVLRFLLDREPKEAILSHFDVSVVARYFPAFEAELPEYLSR